MDNEVYHGIRTRLLQGYQGLFVEHKGRGKHYAVTFLFTSYLIIGRCNIKDPKNPLPLQCKEVHVDGTTFLRQ